jgi:hypothetical protein
LAGRGANENETLNYLIDVNRAPAFGRRFGSSLQADGSSPRVCIWPFSTFLDRDDARQSLKAWCD